jgi:MFS superfamily sulfate permease-like transporter
MAPRPLPALHPAKAILIGLVLVVIQGWSQFTLPQILPGEVGRIAPIIISIIVFPVLFLLARMMRRYNNHR